MTKGRRWIPTWLRRSGLILVSALVVEYFVVPQLSGARSALHLLSAVTPGYLILGLALEFASLMSYSALTRCVLPARARPPLWTILRIDVSALGLSHLVPGGGATATALRYRLLTAAGMSSNDVVSATTIQGVGTAVVLAGVFCSGLLFALPSARHNPFFLTAAAITVALLLLVATIVAMITRHEQRAIGMIRVVTAVLPRVDPDTVQRLVENLVSRLRALAADTRLMLLTMAWASANWLFDAAALWVFLVAFGHPQGLEGLLLGYGLAGVLALLPFTPGGLGLVEGTLVSVLVGFGTPHANAVLGVITWRLAEFWMPIPLAAIAYLSLRTGALRHHDLPARPLIPRPAESNPGSRVRTAARAG